MATISLVSIVKNEQAVLRQMLESVKPIIDEWIVVDTGSTDETPGIIREYAGVVVTLPWEDFVTTKNKAIDMATGNYVLFMDADEQLLSGLDKLKAHAEAGVDCVMGRIAEGTPDSTSQLYYRARLWRNDKRFRFEGVAGIHEYITQAGNVVFDDAIRVWHNHTYRTPESYRERFFDYKARLEAHLEAHPDDTRARFYLARTLRDLNYPLLAIEQYERYLLMLSGYRDEQWQAAYDSALCWKSLGEYGQAFESLHQAQLIDNRRAEAYTVEGQLHFKLQDFARAETCFRLALSKPVPDDILLFVEPPQYKAIPRDHLTICLDRQKKYRESRELCEQVRQDAPIVNVATVNNLHWLNSRTHLKLFFALGHTPEPVYGGMIEEMGVGGVETTYLELPTELAKAGHDVFVFCRCDQEHVTNGVRFIPFERYGDYTRLSADVIITSRWFDSLYAIGTAHSKKIIWLQDAHFADPNHADAWGLADRVVVSSVWHQQYTAERVGLAIGADHLTVIPLGIRKALFSQAVERDHTQVIYSSNPDRGLSILRDMWPEITAKCPGIHLKVAYGWEGLKTWSADAEWQAKIERDRVDMLTWARTAGNVEFTGRLKKSDLARVMKQSALCLYPNNFQETFCLTALETQAAGTPMITTQYGALPTTLSGEGNVLLKLDPFSAEYRRRFIESVEWLYHNDTRRGALSALCLQHVASTPCDWSDVARQWERLIFEVTG